MFDIEDASKNGIAHRLATELFELVHTGEFSCDFTETVRQFLVQLKQTIDGDLELANLIKTHILLIAADKINGLCDQYESSTSNDLGLRRLQ